MGINNNNEESQGGRRPIVIKKDDFHHTLGDVNQRITLSCQKAKSKEQAALDLLAKTRAEFLDGRRGAVKNFCILNGDITADNFSNLEEIVRTIEMELTNKLIHRLRAMGFNPRIKLIYTRINQRDLSTCVATSLMNAKVSLDCKAFPADKGQLEKIYHEHTDLFLNHSDKGQADNCRSLNDVTEFISDKRIKFTKDPNNYHFEQTGSLLEIAFSLITGNGRAIGIHANHCVLIDNILAPPQETSFEIVDPLGSAKGKAEIISKAGKCSLETFSRRYTYPLDFASFVGKSHFNKKSYSAEELNYLLDNKRILGNNREVTTSYRIGLLSITKNIEVIVKKK